MESIRLYGKYVMLEHKLNDTRSLMSRGSLVQPASERTVSIAPDHAAGIDRARLVVNHNAPELLDVRIDLAYTNKLNQFRLVVDKQDQGRALVLNNLLKDSNGDLRITLNSTGLSQGIYTARIEAYVFKGSPMEVGWLILEGRFGLLASHTDAVVDLDAVTRDLGTRTAIMRG